MTVSQKPQKFRAGIHKFCTRTRTPPPGIFTRKGHTIAAPRVLCHGRTDLTEFPGTCIVSVVSIELAEFPVRVIPGTITGGMVLYLPYRTQPSGLILRIYTYIVAVPPCSSVAVICSFCWSFFHFTTNFAISLVNQQLTEWCVATLRQCACARLVGRNIVSRAEISATAYFWYGRRCIVRGCIIACHRCLSSHILLYLAPGTWYHHCLAHYIYIHYVIIPVTGMTVLSQTNSARVMSSSFDIYLIFTARTYRSTSKY